MVSKTAMLSLVRSFKWLEVDRALGENPRLTHVRDKRGRNWLHVCCAVNPRRTKLKPEDSIKIAEALLKRGLDLNQEAFREGEWKATPLWYAIAHGQNLLLAEYLLKHGANPNYCLWAAAFNNDLDAIRLLIRHGADVNDASAAEGESPFLWAVKISHFPAAEELLRHGADVNFQDARGMTPLHYMLKKGSDKKHFAMLVNAGARGDLGNKDGVTAAEIMRKKRDSDFHALAARLRSG